MKKFIILIFLLPLIAFANDKLEANHLCPASNGEDDQVISMQFYNNDINSYMITPGEKWDGIGTYYFPPDDPGRPYAIYCLDIEAARKTDTSVAQWANNQAQAVTGLPASDVLAFVTNPYVVEQKNFNQYETSTSLNWAVNATIEIQTGDQYYYICNNFIFGQDGGKDSSDIYWIYMNVPNPNNSNNLYVQCTGGPNNAITYFSLSVANTGDTDGWITMTRVGSN